MDPLVAEIDGIIVIGNKTKITTKKYLDFVFTGSSSREILFNSTGYILISITVFKGKSTQALLIANHFSILEESMLLIAKVRYRG